MTKIAIKLSKDLLTKLYTIYGHNVSTEELQEILTEALLDHFDAKPNGGWSISTKQEDYDNDTEKTIFLVDQPHCALCCDVLEPFTPVFLVRAEGVCFDCSEKEHYFVDYVDLPPAEIREEAERAVPNLRLKYYESKVKELSEKVNPKKSKKKNGSPKLK